MVFLLVQFGQYIFGKNPIWIASHTFLESKHTKNTENLNYVLFPEVSRKL